jgi:rhodanese-related sulfurtransferase
MRSEDRYLLNVRTQRAYPFTLLSNHRATEAIESVRIFQRGAGNQITLQITLRGGNVADWLYMLRGKVRISGEGGDASVIYPQMTRLKPVRLPATPRALTLTAEEEAVVCRADEEVLDFLATREAMASDISPDRDEVYKRIATLRQSLAFRRLPLECVEEAVRRMRRAHVKQGHEVVREGEPGDAFYVIESGRFEVWQTGLYDDEPRKVAERGAGDAFGDESLVLKGRRNATVRAITAGTLLVLDQADFKELVSRPMIEKVESFVARVLLDSGFVALDVRYQEEYEESHIPNAILMPLPELRDRYHELDPNKKYVICCRGGGRSAVATLLMRQRNYNAVSLKGGIRDWPFELKPGNYAKTR